MPLEKGAWSRRLFKRMLTRSVVASAAPQPRYVLVPFFVEMQPNGISTWVFVKSTYVLCFSSAATDAGLTSSGALLAYDLDFNVDGARRPWLLRALWSCQKRRN